MEFALHLLPYILVPPIKREQRISTEESSTNFIQMHQVSDQIMIFICTSVHGGPVGYELRFSFLQ
jgi:hypothetical protein